VVLIPYKALGRYAMDRDFWLPHAHAASNATNPYNLFGAPVAKHLARLRKRPPPKVLSETKGREKFPFAPKSQQSQDLA